MAGKMAVRKGQAAARILSAAWTIVRTDGPEALTFDAVAASVGVSKQAVLYWFPNKPRLLEAMVRPALEAEAVAARGAAMDADPPTSAIRAIIEALAAFHLSDLPRFRLMYVSPQLGHRTVRSGVAPTTLGRVHPATVAMIDQIAGHLTRSGRYKGAAEARRAATAIHTSLLGLILRLAMADALNAPLRHQETALVDALLDLVAPQAA